MKTPKYKYNKIIQGNYGHGWEDVSEYDCNSSGSMSKEERELLKNDLKEYKASGQGTYRVIFRKSNNSKGMKSPARKPCRKAAPKKKAASKRKEGVKADGTLKKGFRYVKGGRVVKAKCAASPKRKSRTSKKR